MIGGPGGLVPPTESLIAGSNFFESLEGMLVKVVNAQAVGPTNGFGEIFTVVDNDADPSQRHHGHRPDRARQRAAHAGRV